MICCKEIDEYIKFVDENPNETDEEIKLLIKNIVKPTLLRDDVLFDEETFKKAIQYCEKWYYKLFAYQKFAYALFFMYDKYNLDVVIFPDILILMARGNGKDGMIMPLANFLQTPYYGVKNYHIDIVATSEEQALNSFSVVYNMLEENKTIMRKSFYWNKTEVINKKTHSVLRYNTANAKTKDGKQIGMIIFNELHAYEDYNQLNVYTSGLGKIKHSRTVTITTNGKIRGGPLDEKLALSIEVLNGASNFLGLLPIIYKINDSKTVDIPMKKFMETENKEDIDITVWCQANPSLRYMPVLKNELIKDYVKMKKQKSYRVEFFAKRMNLPQQDEEETVTEWNNILRASYSDIDNLIPRETVELNGKFAVVGIDYASLNDFASAGFLFKVDGEYIWRQKTWICSKNKFFNDIKFPFDNIGQEGFQDFVVINEESIDPELIVNWVISQMNKYNIKKWIMDMYRFQLFKNIFNDYGITIETKDNPYGEIRMVRYPNSVIAMIAPRIEVAFSEGKINIGDSAIMRWAINNTCAKKGKDGNIVYAKIEPKLRKNDPFMAFAMAMTGQELLDIEVIYV